jgi:23S rRNA pseudouridine2604 synthase
MLKYPMATLKVAPKSTEASKPSKPPVRRADPSKRDRSKPFIKAERPAEAPAARQRNHRHDGTLHDAQKLGHEPATKPAKPLTPDSRAPAERPILRSEYKDRDRTGENPRANARADTTRQVADREGAYRNPPRRGGKARDGFVASEFDKTRSNKERFANKPTSENAELPRLSKRMAELGLCSRREADEWIANGWVKVDGVIIDALGTRIQKDAEIIISGYAKEHQAENVTIILHKPVGYVSGQAEDGYQPAIVLVHPDNQWPDDPELHQHHPKQFHRGMLRNLAPAGRLDIDSTGMLVLTQDGRIARHLIGEDSSVEKEYLVRVEGTLSDADLKKLNHGLSLDGEQLKPAKVSWQNEDQLRFVLREGKKRQIRRMCEMVGLHVVGLKRVRIGSVNLGKLPAGQWRYLRADERF